MKRIPSWYISFGVVNIALGAFSQLLPLYAYFLGAKAAEVGLLSAVGSATSIAASLFWGKLADATLWRRPYALFGLFGLAGGYALVGVFTHIKALYLLNAGVTFVWTAAGTVATLLILAVFSRREWEGELGKFNAVGGVGWTVGLLLGALWTMGLTRFVGEGWGLRSLSFVVALIALAAGFLGLKSIPEPMGAVKGALAQELTTAMGNFVAELRRYGPLQLLGTLNPLQLLRFFQGKTAFGPEMVLCYYGEFLSFVAFSLVFAPFPVFLRQALGWPNELVFGLYVAHHVVSVVAYRWARRAIELVGHRLSLSLAIFLRIGIFVGFAAVGNGAPAGLLPFFFAIAGLSWSFFQLSTTALVSRLSPTGMRGQALGLYNAVAGLGNVVGAILGGYLADAFGFIAPFLSSAALLGLTLPILLVEGRPVE